MEETAAPATVVHVSQPGDYVSRDAFAATIGPIQDDITEIKGDVKLLLERDARRRAVSSAVARVGTVGATLAAGSIGALVTMLVHLHHI